jgi:hypothetical protein
VEGAHHRADLETDQLLEQRFLVGEVQIDRAFGDASTLGDVLKPGSRKAAGGKLVECGFKDGFATGGRLGKPCALARGRDGSPAAGRGGVSRSCHKYD